MKEFYEQLGSCLITFIFFACMQSDAKAETPILWPPHVKSLLIGKKLWCWERLGAGGEGDNRGWDGWMASPTRWTRVWVNSGSWGWTGRPGVLQFIGSQRVDTTEWLNWTEPKGLVLCDFFSPMKCSLPGSSVCGIFQARILKWVAISFSRESLDPKKACPSWEILVPVFSHSRYSQIIKSARHFRD